MKHFKKYPRRVAAATRIAASEGKSAKQILSEICSVLRSWGIDTTKHKYEMVAEEYERYSSGSRYTVEFICPGDYLAYFAMTGHRAVTTLHGLVETVCDYYISDLNNLKGEMEESMPKSLEAMEEKASEYWWGDGDDYIFYLRNLDTGEVLYDSGNDDMEGYESDEGEWDDWD